MRRGGALDNAQEGVRGRMSLVFMSLVFIV
jgi:hypothetical protein